MYPLMNNRVAVGSTEELGPWHLPALVGTQRRKSLAQRSNIALCHLRHKEEEEEEDKKKEEEKQHGATPKNKHLS